MNPKVIMLAFAGLCGLGAFWGTTRLIRKAPEKAVMQSVVVASRDMKVEEVAKADGLVVVEMDKSRVPAGAFAAIADVEGRWLKVAVLEGEPVIDRKLAPKGSPPGMVSRIPDGMRAYTVDVTEQTGVSGFILPGHRVDVLHSLNRPNGESEARPILQDVLVLASGTTITRPDDRAIQSKTVTLAVSPEQVEILVAARATGALSLALRGLHDHVVTPVRPKADPTPAPAAPAVVALKPVETSPVPPAAAPRPKLRRHVVHVYRGGAKAEQISFSAAGAVTGAAEVAEAVEGAEEAGPLKVAAGPGAPDAPLEGEAAPNDNGPPAAPPATVPLPVAAGGPNG